MPALSPAPSTEQFRTIQRIVKRAFKMYPEQLKDVTPLHLHMDISVVNDYLPLRLDEFLAADDFNFAHDVFGIMNHLNRDTKRLRAFLPRFAKTGGTC